MFIERLKIITFCVFYIFSIGILVIGFFGLFCVVGLIVSLVLIISTVSVLVKLLLISFIFSTMLYGIFVLVSNTFICLGKRFAIGWISKRILILRARNFLVILAIGYCVCAIVMSYFGVMIIEWEFFSSFVVFFAVISRCLFIF